MAEGWNGVKYIPIIIEGVGGFIVDGGSSF